MRELLVILAVIAITWNVAYYVYRPDSDCTEPTYSSYYLPNDALWCPSHSSYWGGRDCIYYEENNK